MELAPDAVTAAQTHRPAFALIDLRLGHDSGLALIDPLKAAREERPDVEGFGLVFLEANACGTAVIGSTSGGISDAVVDGETGLLVPPEAPGPLAEAAIRLLNDAGLRQRLGEQGRARVLRDFTWERMATQLSTSMARLLSAP